MSGCCIGFLLVVDQSLLQLGWVRHHYLVTRFVTMRLECTQVFCIQFYLGTTRLQLEHKGDDRHHYTNFANVIVSFGFVVIPVIGWLLDHKGYGVTMGTINCIGVICSVLEAIPSLRLQVRLQCMSSNRQRPHCHSGNYWMQFSHLLSVSSHL